MSSAGPAVFMDSGLQSWLLRLSGAMLRCLPLLIAAFLIPEPYKMALPGSLAAFLLSLSLYSWGLMVLVSISMLIYISMFITILPVGSMVVFHQ